MRRGSPYPQRHPPDLDPAWASIRRRLPFDGALQQKHEGSFYPWVRPCACIHMRMVLRGILPARLESSEPPLLLLWRLLHRGKARSLAVKHRRERRPVLLAGAAALGSALDHGNLRALTFRTPRRAGVPGSEHASASRPHAVAGDGCVADRRCWAENLSAPRISGFFRRPRTRRKPRSSPSSAAWSPCGRTTYSRTSTAAGRRSTSRAPPCWTRGFAIVPAARERLRSRQKTAPGATRALEGRWVAVNHPIDGNRAGTRRGPGWRPVSEWRFTSCARRRRLPARRAAALVLTLSNHRPVHGRRPAVRRRRGGRGRCAWRIASRRLPIVEFQDPIWASFASGVCLRSRRQAPERPQAIYCCAGGLWTRGRGRRRRASKEKRSPLKRLHERNPCRVCHR